MEEELIVSEAAPTEGPSLDVDIKKEVIVKTEPVGEADFNILGIKPKRKRGRPANKKRGQNIYKGQKKQSELEEYNAQIIAAQSIKKLSIKIEVDEMVGKIEKKKLLDVMSEQFNSGDIPQPARATTSKRGKRGRGKWLKKEYIPEEFLEPASFDDASGSNIKKEEMSELQQETPNIEENLPDITNDLEFPDLPRATGVKRSRSHLLESLNKTRSRVGSQSPVTGKESPISESSNDSGNSRSKGRLRQAIAEEISSLNESKQSVPVSSGKRGRGRVSLSKSEHNDVKRFNQYIELTHVTKSTVGRPKKIDTEGSTSISLMQNIMLKTIKKKKKHFKGLKYSFGLKKKKPKPKSMHTVLDSSQDNESIISEDVDVDSFDSSSVETSSAQMSTGLDPYDPTEEFDDSHIEKKELSFQQHRRLHKDEEEDQPVEEENLEADEEQSWGVEDETYVEDRTVEGQDESYTEQHYEQATEDMTEDYQEVTDYVGNQVEYVETEEQDVLDEDEERLSGEEERPYEEDADVNQEYGELLEEEYEDVPIDYDVEGNEEAIANGIEYMNDTNEGIRETIAYENEQAEGTYEYDQLNDYTDEQQEYEMQVDSDDEEHMEYAEDEQEPEYVEQQEEIDEEEQHNVNDAEYAEESLNGDEEKDVEDEDDLDVDEERDEEGEECLDIDDQKDEEGEECLDIDDQKDEAEECLDIDNQKDEESEECLGIDNQKNEEGEDCLDIDNQKDEESKECLDIDDQKHEEGKECIDTDDQKGDEGEECLDIDDQMAEGDELCQEEVCETIDENYLEFKQSEEDNLKQEDNLNEEIVQEENLNVRTVQEERMCEETNQTDDSNEGAHQEEKQEAAGEESEKLNHGLEVKEAKLVRRFKKTKKVKVKKYKRPQLSSSQLIQDGMSEIGHKRKRSDETKLIKSKKRILEDNEIVSFIEEGDCSEAEEFPAIPEQPTEDVDQNGEWKVEPEKDEDQSSDSSQQNGEKLSAVEDPVLGILAEEYSTDTSEASMNFKGEKSDSISRRASKRRNGDSICASGDDKGDSRKSKRLNTMSSTGVLTLAARSDGKTYPKLVEEIDQKVANSNMKSALCKCRVHLNPKAANVTGEVYCQGFDCFDGRLIGCCNIVGSNTYLRVSPKIPFMLLCNIHRQRLRRHNCCPGCGLFCTQGVFSECRWDTDGIRHYYHKLCGMLVNGVALCPHCGTDQPPVEVHLELKLSRKPVIYLKQHQEKKGLISTARMTCPTLKSVSDTAVAEKNIAPDAEHVRLPGGIFISAVNLPIGISKERLEDAIRSIKTGKAFNIKASPKAIYWACKYDDLEKLLWVLVSGLSPNAKVREYGNQTGLHTASMYGSLASAHILVLAGACFDLTDTQLLTPLMVAITKGHNDMCNYLIQAGANLHARTDDGMTCLHLAAKAGNYDSCKHILDSGRLSRHTINVQDEGGWTPLVWASENRCINVVKLLLERGADPQICDVEQNTALHWAAFSGSTHICSMVLERGCSLKSMNGIGDTPLHIAARQNHVEVVVQLLARGARLDVTNKRGQSPLECCFPESQSFLHITLNKKLLDVMRDNGIRTERIMCSDIACGKESVPITCVNGVDDEELPKNYVYISENCEALNVNIDRTISSLKWCECRDGCNTENCVCSQLNFQCWYDPEGKLLVDFNYADPPMIFECNRACGCNKLSCHNRVVQHGITAHMQLFRTSGKGWGVRALKDIAKGSYVCEYVGEIITDLEADQREDDSYLFDLDNRDTETYCIDARQYANVARFINHLCEPNLTPVKVFIDHQDLVFPRIAFFANRDIIADEELGFDYGEKFWVIKYKQFTCACGGEKCKYSSETIHATLEAYNRKNQQHQQDVPGVLVT